jgi:hypothetical protein
MGNIKGQKEYLKFKEGSRLTRKEAMLIMCYECNGEEEGGIDCRSQSCPMYQFMPFKGKKKGKLKKEALRVVQREFVEI